MSALGQKRTLNHALIDVRFAPESGHKRMGLGMSALCQKRTFTKLPVRNKQPPRGGLSKIRAWQAQLTELFVFFGLNLLLLLYWRRDLPVVEALQERIDFGRMTIC